MQRSSNATTDYRLKAAAWLSHAHHICLTNRCTLVPGTLISCTSQSQVPWVQVHPTGSQSQAILVIFLLMIPCFDLKQSLVQALAVLMCRAYALCPGEHGAPACVTSPWCHRVQGMTLPSRHHDLHVKSCIIHYHGLRSSQDMLFQ